MIFFDGEIYENDMCDKLLARFEDRICAVSYTHLTLPTIA